MGKRKPFVFVIMPFDDNHMALYEKLKDEFSDDYELMHAGDLDNQQNILKDIVEGIYNSDVIIADLTDLNPNVFYELGLAHAIDKKVIIITQDIEELPFDIKSYRVNEYSLLFYKMPELIDKLRKLLSGAVDNSIQFGNPITDFIPKQKSEENNQGNDDKKGNTNLEFEDSNGLIDFINEIVENAGVVAAELTSMGKEVGVLNDGVNQTAVDINRVKLNGKQVDTNYVRNICRKLSEPINQFSDEMKGHIRLISESWGIIEDNYLLLLDSKFIQTDENKAEIKNGLKELVGIKDAFSKSCNDVAMVTNNLKSFLGLERRLNRAVSSLLGQINEYSSMSETIGSSIERIVGKGQVVLGD